MSAGRYGTVHAAFWTDDKTSTLPDQAKLLALYLMTSAHATSSGSMRLPDAYVSADLGWGMEDVRRAFLELVRIGFVVRHPAGWTVIRNRLKYDPPQNPKHLQSIVAKIEAPKHWEGYRILHQTLRPWCEKYGVRMDPPAPPPNDGPGDGIKNDPGTVPDTLSNTLCHTSVTVSDPVTVSVTEEDEAPAGASPPVDEPKDRAGQPYAFVGRVIRLTGKDFASWEAAYRYIDLRARLVARDAYLDELPPDDRVRKNWFAATSQYLANLNDAAKGKGAKPTAPQRKARPAPSDDPPVDWARLRKEGMS